MFAITFITSLSPALLGKRFRVKISQVAKRWWQRFNCPREEGRHTTTASRLHDCDAGGRIIDSPGVRDFAPAIDDLEPRALGFREIGAAASDCRFQDCKHMHEPGCAVATALDQGHIDARRYESYRRLRRLYEQLWDKRPAGERAARR